MSLFSCFEFPPLLLPYKLSPRIFVILGAGGLVDFVNLGVCDNGVSLISNVGDMRIVKFYLFGDQLSTISC